MTEQQKKERIRLARNIHTLCKMLNEKKDDYEYSMVYSQSDGKYPDLIIMRAYYGKWLWRSEYSVLYTDVLGNSMIKGGY